MRSFQGVMLIGVILLSGCEDALCRRMTTVADGTTDKGGTCLSASPSFPMDSCSVGSTCDELDRERINDYLDCLEALAPCDPATDTKEGGLFGGKFQTESFGCLFKMAGMDKACADSFGRATTPDAGTPDAGPTPGVQSGFSLVVGNAVNTADFTLEFGLSGQQAYTRVFTDLTIAVDDIATREDLFDAEPGQKLYVNLFAVRNGTRISFTDVEIDIDRDHGTLILLFDDDQVNRRFVLNHAWEIDERAGGGGSCASPRGYCTRSANCCSNTCCGNRCCGTGVQCGGTASDPVCE